MIRILKITLAAALVIAAAQAEAKTAKPQPAVRVASAFAALSAVPSHKPHRVTVPMKSSRYYDFNHVRWFSAGRALIIKECGMDLLSDPTEQSCKAIWARI